MPREKITGCEGSGCQVNAAGKPGDHLRLAPARVEQHHGTALAIDHAAHAAQRGPPDLRRRLCRHDCLVHVVQHRQAVG